MLSFGFPQVADTQLVPIEKMVFGGEGLGRLNGEVVLTPFVLPGEQARVELLPARKGVRRGVLEGIESPSPDRVEAPCTVFGRCGGCHYQHAAYSAQLRYKRDVLVETLARVGKVTVDAEAIRVVSGPPFGYRNRVQFHFERGQCGFREMNSHRLVPISGCDVAAPALGMIAERLSRMARDRRWPGFLESLEVFTDDVQIQWNVRESKQHLARHFFDWLATEFPGTVPGALDYAAGDDLFRVSGGSFFQINRFLVRELATEAIGDAAGDIAWDLYAGVGLFTLPLARRFGKVLAVESGRSAADDLRFNAERAGVTAEVEAVPVEEWLAADRPSPDLILADPPRAGLGKLAVRRLVELKPRKLVLIACDPATLARDLAPLLEAYSIERMTLIDLFPQTYHIETIAQLGLR